MSSTDDNRRQRFFTRRRYVRLAALIAVAAIAVGAWRYWQDQKQRPRRIFENALSSLRNGELTGVDAAIETLETEPGYATQTRLLRGAMLAERGQYNEALLELRYIPLDGEFRRPALYWAGRCLQDQGKLAEALDAFHQVVSEEPDHVAAHRRLAEIYRSLGAMPAVLAELKHVERLSPADYTTLYHIGTIYHHDMRKEEEAAEYYRKALACDPPEPARVEISIRLAETLLARRNYREALRVVPDRNQARVLAIKAECELNLDRKEAARSLLARALKLDPDLRAAIIFQAKLQLADRTPKAAIPSLKRILKNDPHDYPARYLMAQAFRRAGDTAAANRELQRMEESKRLRLLLQDLYRQAMNDVRDARVRERIAVLCEKLDQQRLATMWKHAARIARQRRPDE